MEAETNDRDLYSGMIRLHIGYRGATEQKTRLRLQATLTIESGWAPEQP